MNLKKLINKSWYGSIGYIEDNATIDLFVTYLLYNKPVLDEFKNHIFAFTYKTLDLDYLQASIETIYPNASILTLDTNRGHNFGTADLDNAVFEFCKNNNSEWLCKASNDMIYNPAILDKKIGEADFYYMNGIGYGGMEKYNFDFDRIIQEDFYPQTNFYFINTFKTDYLNNSEYLDETYQYIQQLPEYNGRVWEYIPGWSCEGLLKECVERNNLLKEHLILEEKYRILLQMVQHYQIHDCSHKNIMIEGICHLQHSNDKILDIS